MDIIKSFMLEEGLFRGTYINADKTIENIWNKHHYPEVLRGIFGEAVVIALMLSNGIKYQGVFSLQIKGDGAIKSLFVDVTTDKKVRGYITFEEEKLPKNTSSLKDLFGKGQLIFSVAGLGQEPYQGIVILGHDKLVDVVKDYFRMSEQIDTEIILRSKGNELRGILLQRMPDKKTVALEKISDLWETVTVLLGSVQNKELFSNLKPDEILFRLFHANKLTVFEPKEPVFECRCYRGKMENFLKKMSSEDRATLYNDKDEISVACQFCSETYTFTKKNLGD